MTTANLKFTKNNHVKLLFKVRDRIGNPVNVTGWSIKWEMKMSKTSLADVTKTVGSGIVIEDGLNGIFSVLINPDDTVYLEAGKYYHEAVITNNEFGAGQIILRDQITQQ